MRRAMWRCLASKGGSEHRGRPFQSFGLLEVQRRSAKWAASLKAPWAGAGFRCAEALLRGFEKPSLAKVAMTKLADSLLGAPKGSNSVAQHGITGREWRSSPTGSWRSCYGPCPGHKCVALLT